MHPVIEAAARDREIRKVNQALFGECFTKCPECDGEEPCAVCNSTGKVSKATARMASPA